MAPGPGDVSNSDEEIYRSLAPELVRFAMGIVGRSDAADVVAEAVVKGLSSPNWNSVKNHRAYLYRAVLNQATEEHRRRASRRALERAAAGPRTGNPPSEPSPEVLAAVEELSPQQRAVIVLTYWEDAHPAEIASRLGVSLGTVKTHLARARAKLREVLDG